MDLLKTEACQEIDKHAQDLGSLATKIWNLAEPGGKEVKSAEAIIGFLVAHEFVVTKNYRGMPTAFRAEFGESEYGGRKRPNVCFVCRYDANKKKGHVNGNNLGTQVAVAAALGLKAVIRASSAGIGKVTLLGCPNSAKGWLIKMLNRKAFLDIDVVLSAAPGDRTEWNPTYVASKTYRATYTGSLGNMEGDNIIPGTSALDGAVYAYSNILAMKEHFGPGWQAEGVISRGGHSMYVVPTQCETTVKITGPTDRDLALLERRVLPCFDAAAQSSGCELELVLGDKSYRGMINNTTLVYMMQINAYYCGILATPLKKKKIMSSVDIANVSRILPAVRPIFYIGTDAEIGTDEFKMAANTENAHWYANSMGKTLALTAIDFLQTPLTMFNCKQDLVNRLKQEKEETTFMMFPVNQVANLSLATALPADSNTGWSRLM
ncbi:xaa-Arg dipeptidase-like [Physella acuta]|uniref:xaa-Arg dipeptidase-like n=1 Tax=Physella acuta TaxID=109671 RepID=UPI0027DB7883|nr:xaa-Arg dipeptidase-like [Physella acuta]